MTSGEPGAGLPRRAPRITVFSGRSWAATHGGHRILRRSKWSPGGPGRVRLPSSQTHRGPWLPPQWPGAEPSQPALCVRGELTLLPGPCPPSGKGWTSVFYEASGPRCFRLLESSRGGHQPIQGMGRETAMPRVRSGDSEQVGFESSTTSQGAIPRALVAASGRLCLVLPRWKLQPPCRTL